MPARNVIIQTELQFEYASALHYHHGHAREMHKVGISRSRSSRMKGCISV